MSVVRALGCVSKGGRRSAPSTVLFGRSKPLKGTPLTCPRPKGRLQGVNRPLRAVRNRGRAAAEEGAAGVDAEHAGDRRDHDIGPSLGQDRGPQQQPGSDCETGKHHGGAP